MISASSRDFVPGTPLRHFFEWNERRLWRHRRYWFLRQPQRLPRNVRLPFVAAVGSPDIALHAAVFAALEELESEQPPEPERQRILVIRLSAFGDFIQALGPFAAIRRRHAGDRVTLLTTQAFAGFAAELGCFDEVLVDERPGPLAIAAWLALRRRLRQARFHRVYDLQTSQRSAFYAWLMRPRLPRWSGTVWGCSHPHANRGRDRQHTLDKQAEQLLMAGIYPTLLPSLPRFDRRLPEELQSENFALLVPGSSPQHAAKRWPAGRFGLIARALDRVGLRPVVVGTAPEAPLAAAIVAACPRALDLVGQTDLGLLAVLAQRAALTIGNDTGVCHLAAAAGGPVLVLFSRASDPARHAPRGEFVRVLVEPDLAALPAERVIGEALALLEEWQAALTAAIAGAAT